LLERAVDMGGCSVGRGEGEEEMGHEIGTPIFSREGIWVSE
jgi:hypothetical protein